MVTGVDVLMPFAIRRGRNRRGNCGGGLVNVHGHAKRSRGISSHIHGLTTSRLVRPFRRDHQLGRGTSVLLARRQRK